MYNTIGEDNTFQDYQLKIPNSGNKNRTANTVLQMFYCSLNANTGKSILIPSGSSYTE